LPQGTCRVNHIAGTFEIALREQSRIMAGVFMIGEWRMIIRKPANLAGVLLVAAMSLWPLAVGSSPASGKKDFTPFMSSKKEKQIGATEHPKILQEYGGAYKDDNKSGYVALVGGRMASNSELANEPFNFTLLNSRVNNAFALPGGYVYITRQLMSLMNDEAQLASVLGHEVGHVTDRHSAKRYNTSILTSIGALLVGVATGSGDLANLASQFGQSRVTAYSRKQEFKADELGIRYISKAGYDAYAAADMLAALGAQTALDARLLGKGAEQVPSMTSTHPLTQDRVTKATALAQQAGAQPLALPRNRDAFLAAIDGMVVEDTVDQGFIHGSKFTHAKLMFTFTVPQGYALDNGDAAVTAQGPQGSGVQFSGGALAAGESLSNYVARVWQAVAGKTGQQIGTPQVTSINGMETAIASTRVQQQNGMQLDVSIVAYRFADASAYHFLIITPAQLTAQVDGGLRTMINSFRKISAGEAAQLKERRIEIVTVQPGDTMERLASRMAYSDAALDRFMIINSLRQGDQLKPGMKVKLITMAR
jgi:predicted Zn-dependent protease